MFFRFRSLLGRSKLQDGRTWGQHSVKMPHDGLHLAQDGPKLDPKFAQDGHKFDSRGLLADPIVVIGPRFRSKKPQDDRRLPKILLR